MIILRIKEGIKRKNYHLKPFKPDVIPADRS
jgi:hypothetical protein